MGIDSLKSGISSIVNTVAQKVEQAKQVVAPPPPPPLAKPTEEFTTAPKKPVSITGKFTPLQPAGTAKADLSESVSSIRSLAQSGVASNAIGLGRDAPPTDKGEALKKAIAGGSDTQIRKLVNEDQSLLKQLTPAEKGKALETLRGGYTTAADQQAMVHIVKSCETKGELRAVLTAASGDCKQADMHKFDKQMTDHHPYLIADLLNEKNTSLPEAHAKSIQANDHVQGRSNYPSANMDETVNLSGDKASRQKFLDGLTQVDSGRKSPAAHENGCGALTIVASAVQGDDPKGSLSKLCDYNLKTMKARTGVPQHEKDTAELKDLKSRIDSGKPISKKDIDLLQRTTYESLRAVESKQGGSKSDNDLISQGAVKEVFRDSGIGTSGGVPRLVDTDQAPDNKGNVSTEHFVLSKPDGQIYDPWPRKDGHQVITPGSEAAKRYEASFAAD